MKFYVLNAITGQKITVPENIQLSMFHSWKLKKLLKKSFFVHLYITHNGFLQYIDPSLDEKMLDGFFFVFFFQMKCLRSHAIDYMTHMYKRQCCFCSVF